MARADVKSGTITDLDSTPKIERQAGEGRFGFMRQIDDFATFAGGVLNTAIAGNNGSTARMARFPTQAKVKEVWLYSDAPLDQNATQTLAFSLNVAFSDANNDGTPVPYQGLVPSSTLTGVAPVAFTSASVNKIFGTITESGNNKPIPKIEMTWGALMGAPLGATATQVVTGGTYTLAAAQQPLWQFFGYVDGRGNPQDPGGYFDILARAEVVAATGAAGGNLGCIVKYVL